MRSIEKTMAAIDFKKNLEINMRGEMYTEAWSSPQSSAASLPDEEVVRGTSSWERFMHSTIDNTLGNIM